MKRQLLLLLGTMVSTLLMAAPVTQDEALQRASLFLSKHNGQGKQIRLARRQPRLLQAEGLAAAYYVFNVGSDEGFVIASGDDRTPAILGYSDHGIFDVTRLPSNVRQWLDGYARQMEWLDSAPQEQATARSQAPTVKITIGPLLSTQWNQDQPYNLSCPNNCMTGCVATAMAQILYYHAQQTGEPAELQESIADYTTSSYGYKVTGVEKGTAILWDEMLPDYANSSTVDDVKKKAVADLMFYCGASVNMDYSTGASEASSRNVPSALTRYFGYDKGIHIVSREKWSQTEWNNMIYNELKENRPVFYDGSSSDGGHAFIVDGFDGEELFHINWGWGGFCDGYFLLSIANPIDHSGIGAGSGEDGYTIDQEAILGAQPDTGLQEEERLQMSFYNVSINGNRVVFDVYNLNSSTLNFDIALGYLEDDGSITPIVNSPNRVVSGQFAQTKGYKQLNWYISAGSRPDGTYKIVTISKLSSESEWLTEMNSSYNYIEATFADGSVSMVLRPIKSLQLLSVNFASPASPQEQQTVNATISNTGDEFYGTLHLFAQSLTENPTVTDTPSANYYVQGIGATIATGTAETVSFALTPKNSGEYQVWISTDEKGSNLVGTGRLVVDETANAVSDSVLLARNITLSIRNVDSTGKHILGNQAEMVITVVNESDEDFEGYFMPALMKRGSNGRYSASGIPYETSRFAAHSTTEVTRFFDVEVGGWYMPFLYYAYKGVLQQKTGSQYEAVSAATAYMADGTHVTTEASAHYNVPAGAVAVSLVDNNYVASVTPNDNPNCLYYLSEGAEIPEGLERNVVLGSQAVKISISEGALDFTPIKSFTADTICYTRTFSNGVTASTEQWSTICLPFNVNFCQVDNDVVLWKSEINDSIGNFWLMEYLGDEQGKLFFNHARQFTANKPYLITVPGNDLKGYTNMIGVPVTFVGYNALINPQVKAVAASDNYKFVGAMESQPSLRRAYMLNGDGRSCTLNDTASVPQYQAYFAATRTASMPASLPLVYDVNTKVEAEITYPHPMAITMTSKLMAFSCNEDLDFSGVSGLRAYTAAGFNKKTGEVSMFRVYDAPAGTGLLLRGNVGTYEVTCQPSDSYYANLLVAISADTLLMPKRDGYANYVLDPESTTASFTAVDNDTVWAVAGSAYLHVPSAMAAGSRQLKMHFEVEPGDCNDDGLIDVADIAKVISIMASGKNDKDGDANDDDIVDVADIAAILSIMSGISK